LEKYQNSVILLDARMMGNSIATTSDCNNYSSLVVTTQPLWWERITIWAPWTQLWASCFNF